jgi:hypothetical protein
MIGWGRRSHPDAILTTRAAFDVAEAALRALLPSCRGCLCPPEAARCAA